MKMGFGGSLWLAVARLAVVAALLVGVWGRITLEGTVAVESSASGLHSAFGTMRARVDKIVANSSLFIDRLAFIPTVILQRDVTWAGRTREIAIQVEERDGPLLVLDRASAPVLTIANLTFYLSGSVKTVEGLIGVLTKAPITAKVVIQNVTFAVEESSWDTVREDFRGLTGTGGTTADQILSAFTVNDLRVGPAAHLLGVVFRQQSYNETLRLLTTIRRNVSDGRELMDVFVKAERQGPPIEAFLETVVSLDAAKVDGRGPVELNRKLVLSGARDGRTLLNITAELGGGGLARVTPHGQLVLLNVWEDLTLVAPSLTNCSGVECVEGLTYHSAVAYNATGCDCAITLINTTTLSSCFYINELSNALRLLSQAMGAPQVVLDSASDNTTLRFTSFLGTGTCFANATMMCKPEDDEEMGASHVSPQFEGSGGNRGGQTALFILIGVGGGSILLCIVGLTWPPTKLIRRLLSGGGKKKWAFGAIRSFDEYDDCENQPPFADAKGKRNYSIPKKEGDLKAYFREMISGEQSAVEDNAIELEERLATGGYGIVFKGRWKGLPVAVKTVIFQDSPDAAGKEKERAILEAAISSSIAHRNVVQTYYHSFKRLETTNSREEGWDVKGKTQGDWKLYIVQELCEHGSLRSALKQGLFSVCSDHRMLLGAVLQIATDVANGLAHLHQHNVVHGDLNTKNVLLQQDPTRPGPLKVVSKLADFGLSVKMGLFQSHVSDHRAGTPFYMAPEVAQKGVLSKKSDVFSFGVVMWEIYHQSSPVQSLGEGTLKYHQKFPKYPVTCPMLYALLCVVCLSPKPADRPDFTFIKKVLRTLALKLEFSEYAQPKTIQKENLAMVPQLNGKSGAELLELLTTQVELEAAEHDIGWSQREESPFIGDGSGTLDVRPLLGGKEEVEAKPCISTPTHPFTPSGSPKHHSMHSGSRSHSQDPRSWVSALQGSIELREVAGTSAAASDTGSEEQMWSIENQANEDSYVISVSVGAPQSEEADMTFAWDPVINCPAQGEEVVVPMCSPCGNAAYPQFVLASSESVSLGISPSPLTPAGDPVEPTRLGVVPGSLWTSDKHSEMLVPGVHNPPLHTSAPVGDADGTAAHVASGPLRTPISAPPFPGARQLSFSGPRVPHEHQSRFILNWDSEMLPPSQGMKRPSLAEKPVSPGTSLVESTDGGHSSWHSRGCEQFQGGDNSDCKSGGNGVGGAERAVSLLAMGSNRTAPMEMVDVQSTLEREHHHGSPPSREAGR